MTKTVWKQPERKWSPRNKDAALLLRKARPEFIPPDPPIKPVFGLTVAQRIEAENKTRRERIAQIEAANAVKITELKEREALEKAALKNKPRPFHKKAAKLVVAYIKRQARRQGLPEPTPEELQRTQHSLGLSVVQVAPSPAGASALRCKPKPFPKCDRERILRATNGLCKYCAKILSISTMTVDHVVPLSRGGTHAWNNLVAACEPCNQAKGDSMP